ncbi:SSU ribosomal protein S6P [Seinonella peptonophila]|uniref:Small ribosomal subunit protein bS6 n=1 Tax=Seinonella peptonophila TaxID=112248 RepID=A0A1M4WXV5_9BACL|nr:30S ribosomal protein S6 [Seinonella peptonophila]SHE86066.1 SSU ribosomal protein S6P [Seinonella peptonophila]
MSKYEIMFIVRPNVEEEKLTDARNKIQDVINQRGGQITETNDMGRRRFAYVINHDQQKYHEGLYTVYQFETTDASTLTELDRVINIDDRIIRHLTINLDEK